MNIEIISINGYDEMIAAARTCRGSVGGEAQDSALIDYLLRHNHLSPFEFLRFTIRITGVSRVLTHQLVRHRMASYCQESLRSVMGYDMVIPPSVIAAVGEDKAGAMMALARTHYRYLVEHGVPKEDARYILPQASTSKVMMEINARSLFNFFNQRCCIKAHWEIRKLALWILNLVQYAMPDVFRYAGPPCKGYRPACYESPANEFHCQKTKKAEVEPVFVNPEMPEELMAWDFIRQ